MLLDWKNTTVEEWSHGPFLNGTDSYLSFLSFSLHRDQSFSCLIYSYHSRYASFEDDTVPKFMYGSHYSTAGVVLHYHVRQDPFTTLHINLQVRNRCIAPEYVWYARHMTLESEPSSAQMTNKELHRFLLTVSEPFVKPYPEKQHALAHGV